ncbi:DNA/RNA helicase domain-containing protein [Rubritalea spongiae]|uniref:DNA/RNA helicase domain-containing protein n=1 Tax=Rubritalea spongiae TaxID=430797 RepID=A0ABW5E920_9BACT
MSQGHILFEYTIPRMGKRCDCVLLINNHIIILEFKCGSSKYNNQDKIQTIDYALDLKNFHGASHEARLIPVLVATESSHSDEILLNYSEDKIADCLCINSSGLKELIEAVCAEPSPPNIIHPSTWINAKYKPTPTIIEAAQVLYREHRVDDISRNDAEATNLAATSSFIDKVIADSKKYKRKAICFVTGVPGAGKTLAGLNLATSRQQHHANEHAVFLSGNGPLVEVLQTALAQDKKSRTGVHLSTARRETSAFIQNIHHFRDDHLTRPDAPIEKVVIFDEAQRAWTKEKAAKFMKAKKGVEDFDQSEPKFLLDVMDRHEEWCVVVALIGGGQEINDGEAGLPEWLAAVSGLESDWQTHYSPELDTPEYTHSNSLTTLLPNNSEANTSLHLSVSMRSFRAESLSLFINRVISNDTKSAQSLIAQLQDNYPIYI